MYNHLRGKKVNCKLIAIPDEYCISSNKNKVPNERFPLIRATLFQPILK